VWENRGSAPHRFKNPVIHEAGCWVSLTANLQAVTEIKYFLTQYLTRKHITFRVVRNSKQLMGTLEIILCNCFACICYNGMLRCRLRLATRSFYSQILITPLYYKKSSRTRKMHTVLFSMSTTVLTSYKHYLPHV
jgi:hypothetical protein